jgi:putative oxidoreductase
MPVFTLQELLNPDYRKEIGMIQELWTRLIHPPSTGPRATVVIRMMAGGVFLWEGILKFVYLNQGVGRFTKLGLPFPLLTADFVGWLEIIGGILLMLGLGTRLITIPFIIEMLVAMLSTKPRLFLGTLPLPPPPAPPIDGLWAVLHEIRSEYAQIMSCIFLLISGPGPWSLDATLLSKRKETGGRLVGSSAWSPPMTGTRSLREEDECASDPRRALGR